jgi:hypothetical protein
MIEAANPHHSKLSGCWMNTTSKRIPYLVSKRWLGNVLDSEAPTSEIAREKGTG